MITVRRLNGKPITINALLIETIEDTPDTVITLTTGKKFMVLDEVSHVILLVQNFLSAIGGVRGTIMSSELEGLKVFKNKLFMIIIAMLIVITLILVAFFTLWSVMDKNSQPSDPQEAAKASVSQVEGKKLTPAQVKAQTVFMENVLTNLAEKGRVVKASFAFTLDNKKSKEEFETIVFQVKSIVIQTLADMKADQIQGSKGQEFLISTLMNKINELLTEGKVVSISLTDYYVE